MTNRPRGARPAIAAPRRCTACCCSTRPLGLSSNDALQRAKRLLPRREGRPHRHARSAGHRPAAALLRRGDQVRAGQPRCRQALPRDAALGVTHDAPATAKARWSGRAPVAVDRAAHRGAPARSFVGAIDQVPPMHSALKNDGKALYDYARAGIEVERAPRRVTIHAHRRRRVARASGWTLDVRCSKGTYIRTLAEDIGAGARLRRAPGGAAPHRAAARSTCATRVTLDALEALDEAERDALLLPADCLSPIGRRCVLDADDAGRFLAGLRRRLDARRRRRRARLRPASPAPFSAAPTSRPAS